MFKVGRDVPPPAQGSPESCLPSYLVGGGREAREQGQQGLPGLGLRQAELLLRLLLGAGREGGRVVSHGAYGSPGGSPQEHVPSPSG